MKKLLTLMLASLVVSSSGFAALPPLWQGVNELKAILDDQQLSNVIPAGDVIIKIVKIHDGYIIITNKRKAFVKVINEKSDQPGPAKFKVEFGKVKERHHDHDKVMSHNDHDHDEE